MSPAGGSGDETLARDLDSTHKTGKGGSPNLANIVRKASNVRDDSDNSM